MTRLHKMTLTIGLWLAASLPLAASPALWRIADSDTTVYLFGTIHIVEKDARWLTPGISQAFDSATMLVLELEPEELQKAGPLFVAAGTLPNGTNLRMQIGNGVYNDVERAAKQMEVPIDTLTQRRPWFAGMSLSMRALVKAGFDPASGIDKILMKAADAQQKPMVGMETAEMQANLFGKLSPAAEKALLITSLREMADVKSLYGEIQNAWLDGDTTRLDEALNASLSSTPELKARMLTSRNAAWRDHMFDLLNQPGTFFVAVGAGHLVGDKSLIALIEETGIPVRRLE